jgi:hypothetical protein
MGNTLNRRILAGKGEEVNMSTESKINTEMLYLQTAASVSRTCFLNLQSGGWSPNWVHSPRRPFILGLLYLPRVLVRMENLVEWIGRGNRSTRRKPAPAPNCTPQIPLDQIRARTGGAAVGSQRLTAWAMARPAVVLSPKNNNVAREATVGRSICQQN